MKTLIANFDLCKLIKELGFTKGSNIYWSKALKDYTEESAMAKLGIHNVFEPIYKKQGTVELCHDAFMKNHSIDESNDCFYHCEALRYDDIIFWLIDEHNILVVIDHNGSSFVGSAKDLSRNISFDIAKNKDYQTTLDLILKHVLKELEKTHGN